jgi:small subunit ribosomal protein S6
MLVTKKSSPREYELTYLVGTGYTTTEINSIQDEVVALIGKNGGEITETTDWGKKSLAYPLKKDAKTYTEASYTHLIIKLPPEKAQTLTRAVELKHQILRALLVVK